MQVGAVGESELVRRIAARFPGPSRPGEVLLGMGDDGALLRHPAGSVQVITTDLLLENVHFRRAWTPFDLLGHKALAVNLSDVAAMGAAPGPFFLNLGLPQDLLLSDFDALLDGLAGEARQAGDIVLAGGDTCASSCLHIGVTLTGQVRPERVIRREGGQPGDLITVSGPLGDAAAGLLLLEAGWRWSTTAAAAARPAGGPLDVPDQVATAALAAHLRPVPCLRLGQDLGGKVSAGMDLSDGVAADLPRLCAASGCGARVELDRIPVGAPARALFAAVGMDAPRAALAAAEDYSLLVTVTREAWQSGLGADHGLAIIGRLVAAREGLALLVDGVEEAWPEPGFHHFSRP
jgi:thiamine-monophosphate kinase